jgi:hypothetical protein
MKDHPLGSNKQNTAEDYQYAVSIGKIDDVENMNQDKILGNLCMLILLGVEAATGSWRSKVASVRYKLASLLFPDALPM